MSLSAKLSEVKMNLKGYLKLSELPVGEYKLFGMATTIGRYGKSWRLKIDVSGSRKSVFGNR